MDGGSRDGRGDAVGRAYDAVAEEYAALLPDTGHEASIDLAMVDLLVAAVGTGGRVLDAGCGTGRMSRYLADRGVAVEGVDLSPGMVAVARRLHPDLEFTVGSLHRLPYADGVFDGVLLWYSTIHETPSGQPRLYAEVGRVLTRAGHVLVGFQAGHGVHDVSGTFRSLGHGVELVRHRFGVADVAGWAAPHGLQETCRTERRPATGTADRQAAVLLARGLPEAVGPDPAGTG